MAPGRAKRPHDVARSRAGRRLAPYDASCPFCPGNESRTPGETLRVVGPSRDVWAVRAFPNKFAVLQEGSEAGRTEHDHLFREMTGVGFHEVIVETPVHNRFIASMEDCEVEQILRAYQNRYQSLRESPIVKYIIIFKNHGEAAGTSLEHPHSQLVATPIAPVLLRRKYEVAIDHFDDTGRCLYCDLVEAETRAQVRMVMETEHFVVFHPFASRAPFETWIAPKDHQPSFAHAASGELKDLARVLRCVLRGLDTALGDPDFNYIIHSAPAEDEHKAYYLWHLQILPRLATIAGFELGSGIFVSSMLSEESAAVMREVLGKEDASQRSSDFIE